MRKLIFLAGFLLVMMFTFAQSKSKTSAPENLFTAKYAGYYSYGNNADKEGTGSFIIYPETDSTALFYFESNIGPPSYSRGSQYGRIKIKSDTAIFHRSGDQHDEGCKWKFTFSKKKLIVQTKESKCGFGENVTADGEFKQESSTIIEECLDLNGQAIDFKTLKPENYQNK